MTYMDTRRPRRTPPLVGIAELRKARGWTLEQVAAQLSTVTGKPAPGRGTLSAIEGGHRGMSADMLTALACVYGLEPTDFVLPEDVA